jgi:protein-tyrosine phosphatase
MMKLWRALRRRIRTLRALRVARRTTLERLGKAPMRRVLVICYGNIYRSPFAAEFLKRHAPDAEIRSAGFHNKVGRPSPPAHVAAAAERGIDLAGHRSRLVTPSDLDWADTIVLMDRRNFTHLDEACADHGKLVWLGALTDGPVEIDDPYGRSESEASRLLDRLERGSAALAARMTQAT